MEPYYTQMSTSDFKKGYDGCRSSHWAKDLCVPPRDFNPPLDSCVVLVDVDMYIDMPRTLARYPRTYLIATFQPEAVAFSEGNFSFTFNENNEVVYHVSGAATYTHMVWNYASDVLIATACTDPLGLGMWYRTTVYNVERRQSSPHHQLILLVPSVTFVSPVFKASRWIEGNVLERLSPVVTLKMKAPPTMVGDKISVQEMVERSFLRLNVVTQSGMRRSTGSVGEYACANISVVEDDKLAAHARITGTQLSPAQVKQLITNADDLCAGILTEYHRFKRGPPLNYVYPMSESIGRFQYEPHTYEPDAKASLTPFMNPLINETYAPDMTVNNDRQAVRGRVNEAKNSVLQISNEMYGYMLEFAELMFPIPGILHPVDVDEVFARQARPAQQAILKTGELSVGLGKPLVNSFVKREPYQKLTDPRMISTFSPELKYKYSHFTYAMAEHMRSMPWYAFGKTPKEIATRVSFVCQRAKVHAHNTDFSRFDGHVSNSLRVLERIVAQRGFNKAHWPQLSELMLRQFGVRAVTKNGVWYFTGFIRGSGSGETADANSEDNAFVAYVTLRRTKRSNDFTTPREAFDQLGIYGGDDGLTADVDPDLYIRTAKELGQVLECETVKRGELGVSFLSRQFCPEVWTGGVDSMCDLRRQMAKLHVTVNLPNHITGAQKLVEKMEGYILSDANTPIVGPMARAVLSKLTANATDLEEMRLVRSWWSHFSESDQFPNVDRNGWMSDVAAKQLPSFDYALFVQWLVASDTNPAILLTPPLMEPTLPVAAPKRHVVLNGDIIKAPMCKLGSKCGNADCKMEHECLFGANCNRIATCPFKHTPTPTVMESDKDAVNALVVATGTIAPLAPDASSANSAVPPAVLGNGQTKKKKTKRTGPKSSVKRS